MAPKKAARKSQCQGYNNDGGPCTYNQPLMYNSKQWQNDSPTTRAPVEEAKRYCSRCWNNPERRTAFPSALDNGEGAVKQELPDPTPTLVPENEKDEPSERKLRHMNQHLPPQWVITAESSAGGREDTEASSVTRPWLNDNDPTYTSDQPVQDRSSFERKRDHFNNQPLPLKGSHGSNTGLAIIQGSLKKSSRGERVAPQRDGSASTFEYPEIPLSTSAHDQMHSSKASGRVVSLRYPPPDSPQMSQNSQKSSATMSWKYDTPPMTQQPFAPGPPAPLFPRSPHLSGSGSDGESGKPATGRDNRLFINKYVTAILLRVTRIQRQLNSTSAENASGRKTSAEELKTFVQHIEDLIKAEKTVGIDMPDSVKHEFETLRQEFATHREDLLKSLRLIQNSHSEPKVDRIANAVTALETRLESINNVFAESVSRIPAGALKEELAEIYRAVLSRMPADALKEELAGIYQVVLSRIPADALKGELAGIQKAVDKVLETLSSNSETFQHQEDHNALRQDLKTLRDDLGNYSTLIKDSHSGLTFDEFTRNLAPLKSRVTEIKGTVDKIDQEGHNALRQDVDKLTQELKTLIARTDEANKSVEKVHQEGHGARKRDLGILRGDLEKYSALVNQSQSNSTVERFAGNLQTLTTRIDEMSSTVDKIHHKDRDTLRQDSGSLRGELEKYSNTIKESQSNSTVNNFTSDLQTLTTRIDEMNKTVDKLYHEDHETLRQDLNTLRIQLDTHSTLIKDSPLESTVANFADALHKTTTRYELVKETLDKVHELQSASANNRAGNAANNRRRRRPSSDRRVDDIEQQLQQQGARMLLSKEKFDEAMSKLKLNERLDSLGWGDLDEESSL